MAMQSVHNKLTDSPQQLNPNKNLIIIYRIVGKFGRGNVW